MWVNELGVEWVTGEMAVEEVPVVLYGVEAHGVGERKVVKASHIDSRVVYYDPLSLCCRASALLRTWSTNVTHRFTLSTPLCQYPKHAMNTHNLHAERNGYNTPQAPTAAVTKPQPQTASTTTMHKNANSHSTALVSTSPTHPKQPSNPNPQTLSHEPGTHTANSESNPKPNHQPYTQLPPSTSTSHTLPLPHPRSLRPPAPNPVSHIPRLTNRSTTPDALFRVLCAVGRFAAGRWGWGVRGVFVLIPRYRTLIPYRDTGRCVIYRVCDLPGAWRTG